MSAPHGYAPTLCHLFGLPIVANQDLPTAALSYHATAFGQAQPRPTTYLLHADPIHLKPDQDRLLAVDFAQQPLALTEAEQLAALFNAHFADQGIALLIAQADQWYLALDTAPALNTQPLTAVIGRNIGNFMPTGPDAAAWRARLNEVQMLWHQAPPNLAREARGLWPVSGIWLSGGGYLSEQVPRGFAAVSGECLILQGLQQMAQAGAGKQAPQAATVEVVQTLERAVLEANMQAWVEGLQQLEKRLTACLDQELWLYPCAGQVWHWQPWMRYRWWRRTRTIFKNI